MMYGGRSQYSEIENSEVVRFAKDDQDVDDNDCMEVEQMRLGHPRPAESDPSLWVGAISKGIHNPLLMKHHAGSLLQNCVC